MSGTSSFINTTHECLMNCQFKVIQVLNFYKKHSLDNMRVPVLFFFFKQSSACCVVVRNETGFSFKMKVKKQIIKPNSQDTKHHKIQGPPECYRQFW